MAEIEVRQPVERQCCPCTFWDQRISGGDRPTWWSNRSIHTRSGEGIEERFFEIAGDTHNCIAILHEGKPKRNLRKVQPFLRKGQGFLDHYRHLIDQVELFISQVVFGWLQWITMLALSDCKGAGKPVVLGGRGFFGSCQVKRIIKQRSLSLTMKSYLSC